MIIIVIQYEKMEEEYVSSTITYSALAEKYGIPRRLIALYGREHRWVEKRRSFNSVPRDALPYVERSLDVSKLARSSCALESIIESAFIAADTKATAGDIDTKTLKELTAALKEAINIKQNLYLLPMLTEQKQLELEQRKAPPAPPSEDNIRVFLDNGADKFCV